VIFITREEELQIDLDFQSIYFYASWMPYHKKIITMISKIEEKYKIPFYAIDVEQFSNQCKRFIVESIPAILILKKGKEIKRINGLFLTSAFNDVFADICTY
jgi:thiol-disulfide isomerase/thioredoxin